MSGANEHLSRAVRLLHDNPNNNDPAFLSDVKAALVEYYTALLAMDRGRVFRALTSHSNRSIRQLAGEVMSERPIPETHTIFRF